MTSSTASQNPPIYRRVNLTAGGTPLPRQHYLLCGSTPGQLDGLARRLRDDHPLADDFLSKPVSAGQVPETILLAPGQTLPLGLELSWFDNDLGKVDWSKF